MYLVPVLFTFYIQGVLKLKKLFQRQKVNHYTMQKPEEDHHLINSCCGNLINYTFGKLEMK